MATTCVLEAPVLVLNKHWTPITVTTVMEAMKKLFIGQAKVVNAEDYQVYDFDSWAELAVAKEQKYLVLAKSVIKAPDVIVLGQYGGLPEKKLVFSRANIFRRDHYTCQYCGSQPDKSELTIDHVTPKSKGGKTTWENCVASCLNCNKRKDNKSIQESGLKLKREPSKPDWSPRIVLQKVRNTPKVWQKFVSEAYWNTELENDNE